MIASGNVACTAPICWKCNNIYGQLGSKSLHWEFEASSKAARKLLKILEGVVGHAAKE
jgi:hypothetical protein